MNDRENTLKAFTFNKPEWIPIRFSISLASWRDYGAKELEKLILKHKSLFPDYIQGDIDVNNLPFKPYRIAGVKYMDSWGCLWKTNKSGITGTVVKHSLDNWNDFKNFIPPNPNHHNGWEKIDWGTIEKHIKEQKIRGALTRGGLRHGYMFLTLSYMRGFEKLMYDMHDEEPRLDKLIETLETFNREIIDKYITLDVDMIGFPEDLGTQKSSLLSPKMFRRYIKPAYKNLMKPVKMNNILIHMHSDGYIIDIVDDLAECGVDVINLQDLVNGVDEIKKNIKGRMAIDLDIDRQNITVSGSPKDIDDLIREEVIKLGGKKGGLSLLYGLYGMVPLRNIEAIMNAMEKYSKYYS